MSSRGSGRTDDNNYCYLCFNGVIMRVFRPLMDFIESRLPVAGPAERGGTVGIEAGVGCSMGLPKQRGDWGCTRTVVKAAPI
jgi:hypothetical protein